MHWSFGPPLQFDQVTQVLTAIQAGRVCATQIPTGSPNTTFLPTPAFAETPGRARASRFLPPMRKAAVFNWGVYQLAGLTRVRPPQPQWKVGIYRPARLGDFILSLGAIRSIVEEAGEQNCVLLHSDVAAEIAAREFPGVTRIQLPDLQGRLWITWASLHSRKFLRQLGTGIEDMLCLRHYRALFDEVALRAIPSRRVWCVSNSEHYRLEYEIVRRRFSGDVEVPRPVPTGDKTVCEDLLCHQALLKAWKREPVEAATVVPRLSAAATQQQKNVGYQSVWKPSH